MKRPGVNNWAIVYFILNLLPVLMMTAWAVKDGWFPSEKVLLKHPDPADAFYLFNQSLAVFTAFCCAIGTLPVWIMAIGKRKPWIWTTLLVFIALSLSGNPLMGIPILFSGSKTRTNPITGDK